MNIYQNPFTKLLGSDVEFHPTCYRGKMNSMKTDCRLDTTKASAP
jgi:hypothetical protein